MRFRMNHDQMGIVINLMDQFLEERPRGESLNMLHSIVQGLDVRMRRRHAERKMEYRLILPVYQALAFRRICMVGLDLYEEGRARTELRILLAELDPKMTAYTTVTPKSPPPCTTG
ncbi:MAG: hypothetical protein KIT10_14440 [Flavobacteriales bacterium]|nr:hypothetical protein [Flavobacteriales bacterium]